MTPQTAPRICHSQVDPIEDIGAGLTRVGYDEGSTSVVTGRSGPIAGPRWVCVLWWKITSHAKALAGKVPSSGSTADPVKVIVLPALYS